MKPFTYVCAEDVASAVRLVSTEPAAKFLGGGTNLVDLMRENIESPQTLVDVSRLPLAEIVELSTGVVRIGAGVRNSTLAAHELIRRRFPVLSQAILAGASGQLRNMATVGGNLLQRTRCSYFYDQATACNKRAAGSGCAAIGGLNRGHAVLGTSEHCIATHPSDMAVALIALDAVVEVENVRGTRRIPLTEFYLPPGDTPQLETTVAADELITAVELPALPMAANSRYRKVRDRASYAFALASVAAALQVHDGAIAQVRLAFGGIGTTPWRASVAERVMIGAAPTAETFRQAAEAELAAARASEQNAYKIELTKRITVATLGLLHVEAGVA